MEKGHRTRGLHVWSAISKMKDFLIIMGIADMKKIDNELRLTQYELRIPEFVSVRISSVLKSPEMIGEMIEL